jgi:hypothetical protein
MAKLPKSPKEAKKLGYQKVAMKPSEAEKKKWRMEKHKGKWAVTPAESAAPNGPHTVCYYDPNTGFWDDCHQVG